MDQPKTNEVSEQFGTNSKLHAAISKTVTQVIEKTDLTSSPIGLSSCQSKKDDQEHVRRPMNSFMIYARAARKELSLQYPNLSYRKLSKILGQLWKMLDEKDKQPFVEEAERLRRKHRSDHPEYKYQPKKKVRKLTKSDESISKKVTLPNGHFSQNITAKIEPLETRCPPKWGYDTLRLTQRAQNEPCYRSFPQYAHHAGYYTSEALDNKQLFSGILPERNTSFLLEEIPDNNLAHPISTRHLLNQYNVLQGPLTTGCAFPNTLPYFPFFQKTTGLYEGDLPARRAQNSTTFFKTHQQSV